MCGEPLRLGDLTHWHISAVTAIQHHRTLAITFCFCLKRLWSSWSTFTKSRNCISWAILSLIVLIYHNKFSCYFSSAPAVERKWSRALSCPKQHWATLPWEGSLPWLHPSVPSSCLTCSLGREQHTASFQQTPAAEHSEPTWAPSAINTEKKFNSFNWIKVLFKYLCWEKENAKTTVLAQRKLHHTEHVAQCTHRMRSMKATFYNFPLTESCLSCTMNTTEGKKHKQWLNYLILIGHAWPINNSWQHFTVWEWLTWQR